MEYPGFPENVCFGCGVDLEVEPDAMGPGWECYGCYTRRRLRQADEYIDRMRLELETHRALFFDSVADNQAFLQKVLDQVCYTRSSVHKKTSGILIGELNDIALRISGFLAEHKPLTPGTGGM